MDWFSPIYIDCPMAHGPDTHILLDLIEDVERDIHNGTGSFELRLGGLDLTSLPELPEGLEFLSCPDMYGMTSLPNLPSTLKILHVNDTPITELPELPVGLESLSVRNTNITQLPELPNALKYLYVGGTRLTSLPANLPSHLCQLACSHTKIASLPVLPRILRQLDCQGCPELTELPEFPPLLEFLRCDRCPKLAVQREPHETMGSYEWRWGQWREERASREMWRARTKMLKEGIVAQAFHPRRVERWLDAGLDIECM